MQEAEQLAQPKISVVRPVHSSLPDARRQQQVRAKPVPFDTSKLERLVLASGAFAGDGFARIVPAQNLWRIKKGDALGQVAE